MGAVEGKIAVVTGAGRGIGRGIAARLSLGGATVVVADRDESAAHQVAREIGVGSVGIATDVTSRASVDAMVAETIERFGRVDVLVNNAGWDKAGRFVDSDVADWDKIVAINLYGVFHTCQALLPLLVEQGGGVVVNIASDAGRVGSSGEAVYSATKGGVIAFTKTIAREVARSGVRANVVCPGPTDTDLFRSFAGPGLRDSLARAVPIGRIGTPEDVAGAVAFLASDDAAYMTGQTLSVSGGLTMS